MTDRNLPYRPFRRDPGRGPVGGVRHAESVHADGSPARGGAPGLEGRILRVRVLGRDAAESVASRWRADGGHPIEAPAGWHAWERRHADTVAGRPRVQRLAVGPGDPARVVNWSVPAPACADDEAHWARALVAALPSASADGGWTA